MDECANSFVTISEASGFSSKEILTKLNEKKNWNTVVNDYERLTPKQKSDNIKKIVHDMCYHYYSNDGVIEPAMLDEWIEILSRMIGFENHTEKMKFLQKRIKMRKIAFIGSTNTLSKQDIKNICKSYGFSEDQIEIRDDYNKMTNRNLDNLKNKNRYLGLIIGAIPHSIKGVSDDFISYLRNNADDYPPFRVCSDKNNNPSFSASEVKKALSELIRIATDT
ncbi:MAG TPA: hypothetical protein VIL03_03315 [Clostridia bacterium]|jgi:hypothetical protein